jgi:hypothetical protein
MSQSPHFGHGQSERATISHAAMSTALRMGQWVAHFASNLIAIKLQLGPVTAASKDRRIAA